MAASKKDDAGEAEVQSKVDEKRRDINRVDNIRFARFALLLSVTFICELVGAANKREVVLPAAVFNLSFKFCVGHTVFNALRSKF